MSQKDAPLGNWKPNGMRKLLARAWRAIIKLGRRGTTQTESHPSSRPVDPQTDARLPPELFDQVIDYLHDDVDTLQTCTLICRLLLPSARFHLFHTVKITKKNYAEIVSVFTDRAPELAIYVRSLTLETPGETFKDLQKLMDTGKLDRLKVLRAFVEDIAPRTKEVQRLTLKDVPLDNTVVKKFETMFPRLNTLSMYDCWFRCNADLDRLVHDHPAVHTIRCGRVSSLYGESPPDTLDGVGPPISLQHLKITEAYSPSPLTLMPWLVSHCNPEHFVYTVYRLSQITKLNQAIVGLESLRHLHIIFYHWRKPDIREAENSPEVLSLMPHHPPNITTITIDGRTHSLNLAVAMLGMLEPALFIRLHTINLYVHIAPQDIAKVRNDAWGLMDRTLSVLLSLGVVNFYNMCLEDEHLPDGQLAIEERLPVMHARKIMHFKFEKNAPYTY